MSTGWSAMMRTMKYNILRLVFRKKDKADNDVGIPAQRRLQSTDMYDPEPLTSNDTTEKTNVCANAQYQRQLVELPERDAQMTTQDVNNIFPSTIELAYERTIRPNRRKGKIVSKVIAPTSTSFLDLPREIRNEIYRYAVTSDQLWKVRRCSSRKDSANINKTREQLPGLCKAALPFANEVLATHYRYNTIRYSAVNNHNPNTLLSWIQGRGPALVKNIHRLQVTYQLYGDHSYAPLAYPCDITTNIEHRPDGTTEVSTERPRPEDACYCGIAELVQERLLRKDAQENADCVRRIETSTQYGPVLGFALQLLDAVQLAQTHHATLSHLSASDKAKYYSELPADCILCGKRKWVWRL